MAHGNLIPDRFGDVIENRGKQDAGFFVGVGDRIQSQPSVAEFD